MEPWESFLSALTVLTSLSRLLTNAEGQTESVFEVERECSRRCFMKNNLRTYSLRWKPGQVVPEDISDASFTLELLAFSSWFQDIQDLIFSIFPFHTFMIYLFDVMTEWGEGRKSVQLWWPCVNITTTRMLIKSTKQSLLEMLLYQPRIKSGRICVHTRCQPHWKRLFIITNLTRMLIWLHAR